MLTASMFTRLYPTLNLWNANKLHYITTLHSQMAKKQIFLSVFDFQVPVELNCFCTFLLVYKSLKNSQKNIYTFVSSYCLQENLGGNNSWQEIEPLPILSHELSGNVTGLKSGINYEVRVVLLDRDGTSYQQSDVPYANVTTLCMG
jgi:hypothetical protein